MKIEPIYFLMSMFITILILYLVGPEPKIVIRYPNITQKLSDVYVDNKGVLYKYNRIKLK